jgi:GDP-4-dehydro-6-deoxy-D-mannose reductase
MRAFITGMSGFVGRYLAEYLRACGDEVMGTSQRDESPDLIAWDIAMPTSSDVSEAIAAFAPDVIYHLAAISKPEDCGTDQITPQAMAVNVVGTEHVMKLAHMLPSKPRVVFTSSSYVYSPGSLRPIRESDKLAPPNPYGESKCLAEARALAYSQLHDVDVIIARAFQHAGPRQIARFIVSEWSQQFVQGADPVVIRNDEAWIDLLDVRDVVRAYRLLTQHGVRGEIYNVGSGVAQRSGDIFAMLREIADPKRSMRVLASQPKHGPIADITKIATVIGWRPEIPLEQTVRDTYDWAKAHAS